MIIRDSIEIHAVFVNKKSLIYVRKKNFAISIRLFVKMLQEDSPLRHDYAFRIGRSTAGKISACEHASQRRTSIFLVVFTSFSNRKYNSFFVTVDVPADSLVRRPRREPSRALVATLPRTDGHGCPSVRK